MEGHTQGHLKRNKKDVLFRIPKTSYFRTRYREISMIVVHSSEIETKKSLILKEKRLDLLGSSNMHFTFPISLLPINQIMINTNNIIFKIYIIPCESYNFSHTTSRTKEKCK